MAYVPDGRMNFRRSALLLLAAHRSLVSVVVGSRLFITDVALPCMSLPPSISVDWCDGGPYERSWRVSVGESDKHTFKLYL